MRKKWWLIGGAILVLCLLAVVSAFAEGPVNNPIYATMEYVDQQIQRLDDRIDQIGGGGGPDFELPDPESWITHAWENPDGGVTFWLFTEYDLNNPTKTCSWNGYPIGDPGSVEYPFQVQARAVAKYDGEILGYANGCCRAIWFYGLSNLPEVGETVDVEIWFFWMGSEKNTTIPVTVTEPPY